MDPAHLTKIILDQNPQNGYYPVLPVRFRDLGAFTLFSGSRIQPVFSENLVIIIIFGFQIQLNWLSFFLTFISPNGDLHFNIFTRNTEGELKNYYVRH
jgi:hypothetical protein